MYANKSRNLRLEFATLLRAMLQIEPQLEVNSAIQNFVLDWTYTWRAGLSETGLKDDDSLHVDSASSVEEPSDTMWAAGTYWRG